MSDSLHEPASQRGTDVPGRLRESWIIAGAWFVAALVALSIVRARVWALNGYDVFYHLRFATHVMENGIHTHTLPWLRMSVLADQWGDKEFLFRMFLLPFVHTDDLMAGGKWALCVLNALQAATIAFVGVRWGGRRGALLPLLVLGVSMHVWYRLDLLRPHNLSLIILVAAVYFIGRRRYDVLGPVGALYALSYTACQTLWILCAGTFVLLWLDRGERPWRLLVYPALGLGVGMVLHPAFPHNLLIWKLANYDLYAQSDILNLGTEIFPRTTKTMLVQAVMGLFLVGVGILTTRPWSGAARPGRQEVILGGFALAFAGLNFMAYRFIEYAAAFIAMYLFVLYNRLSANPSHAPGTRKARNILMAVLVVYSVLFNGLFQQVTGTLVRQNKNFFASREAMQAFAAALPEQARVAAAWDVTSMYSFAAPHARFLNQVDPVFMFAFDPGLYPVADRLFHGRSTDAAAVARDWLDSDYVALPVRNRPRLYFQLLRDPRFTTIYEDDRHAVFKIDLVPGFVTDWDFAFAAGDEETVFPPPDSAFFTPDWPWSPARAWVAPQPLSDLPGGGPPAGEPRTWWARRTITVESNDTPWVRFSAEGRADIRVDGELVTTCRGGGLLSPGQMQFRLPLVPGQTHRIEVRVTPTSSPGGFFWQEASEPVDSAEAASREAQARD